MQSENTAMYMGFEHPTPRKMRAEPVTIYPDRDYLSEYSEMKGGYGHFGQDDCSEGFTWPEVMDQRLLERLAGPLWLEDAEEDDAPGGNVTDEPHDARDEDGI